MIAEKKLTRGCCLRQIELSDCTSSYVEWLNDPDVNQYLETRWSDQTIRKPRVSHDRTLEIVHAAKASGADYLKKLAYTPD